MRKEEIQALYERAQAESRGGQLYEYFAKLVEQATLERAAKHFDDRGKHADGSWSSGWYDPESPGIILRALKDSHE